MRLPVLSVPVSHQDVLTVPCLCSWMFWHLDDLLLGHLPFSQPFSQR